MTLLGSTSNFLGHFFSICFISLISIGMWSTPSWILFLACQYIRCASELHQKNCINLRMIVIWQTLFQGIVFPFIPFSYLIVSHFGNLLNFSYGPLYNMQSLIQALYVEYYTPISFKTTHAFLHKGGMLLSYGRTCSFNNL